MTLPLPILARKASVLVVDDDEDLRTTLPLILSIVGYHVRAASDGVTALAEIAANLPDILISDLNMPGMSGFDLLRIVRENYPAMHTIAMSSEYCGSTVPQGVIAEAFHPKATGVPALLSMVSSMKPLPF